jgi:hypothetical protein
MPMPNQPADTSSESRAVTRSIGSCDSEKKCRVRGSAVSHLMLMLCRGRWVAPAATSERKNRSNACLRFLTPPNLC